MNDNSPKIIQFNFPGINNWLTIILCCLLLGSVGLGWVVKSALIIIGLIIILPIIGGLALWWWYRQNYVISDCPSCGGLIAGLNSTQLDCPTCGEALTITNKTVQRLTPPGTIDVVAVEVDN